MKKSILTFLLLTATILTSGCTKTKEIEPQLPQTDFTTTITCGNEKYTVTHNGKSITSITITEPEELNGLTYSYKGSVVTLNYKSLSYTPSVNSLPATNSVALLHNALCEVSAENFNSNFTIKTANSDTTIYESKTTEITCKTSTGNINQIKLKNNGKCYKFSNYS